MTLASRRSIELHPWDAPSLLDRAPGMRNEAGLQAAWRHAAARVIDIDRDSRFMIDPLGAPVSGELDESVAFLGLLDDRPWFTRRVAKVDAGSTIRDSQLTDAHYLLVSAALAILNWSENTRYCARCAGALLRRQGGFAAVCTMCQREHFPRTDPAVIVAVLDPDDRIFLAHQGSWDRGRASILAGFVEAGESAENAVYREVAEEARLVVDSCRFLGSQPWPFPRSLMLAYVARSRSEGRVDQVELEWGGWYSRDDVNLAEAEGRLILPGPGSVAGRVLTAWRAGVLPSPDGAWSISADSGQL